MCLQVGQNKMKTHIAEGGETAVFDFAGSLEVSDGVTEMVCELKHNVTGNLLGPARLIGQVRSSSSTLLTSSTPDHSLLLLVWRIVCCEGILRAI